MRNDANETAKRAPSQRSGSVHARKTPPGGWRDAREGLEAGCTIKYGGGGATVRSGGLPVGGGQSISLTGK